MSSQRPCIGRFAHAQVQNIPDPVASCKLAASSQQSSWPRQPSDTWSETQSSSKYVDRGRKNLFSSKVQSFSNIQAMRSCKVYMTSKAGAHSKRLGNKKAFTCLEGSTYFLDWAWRISLVSLKYFCNSFACRLWNSIVTPELLRAIHAVQGKWLRS